MGPGCWCIVYVCICRPITGKFNTDNQTQPRRSRDQSWLWRERGFGFRFCFYPNSHQLATWHTLWSSEKKLSLSDWSVDVSVRDCLERLNWHRRVQSTVSQCSFHGGRWSSKHCVRKLVKPEPLSQPQGEPVGHASSLFLIQIPAMSSCSDIPQWCPSPYKLILVSVLSQQLKWNSPRCHEVSFPEFPFSAWGSQAQSILLSRETKATLLKWRNF